MSSERSLIVEYVKRFLEPYGVEGIVLFGSRVRGVSRERSDYDVIVVGGFPGIRGSV